MAEIIKVFKENIPTMRFIGKKYDNFGHWGEWWQNGWFDLLEQTMGGTDTVSYTHLDVYKRQSYYSVLIPVCHRAV